MSHAKDVLSDQLLANANDPSFYVLFSDAVAKLAEEEAFWKPNDESNSIAEIVQHHFLIAVGDSFAGTTPSSGVQR
ncbi:hypothetical protein J6TS2_39720 [Heyndrickxia sporothermodurans]|nr:hypothetical protein J6TS2_39720 [Heyndrickxia sporothermodurans]